MPSPNFADQNNKLFISSQTLTVKDRTLPITSLSLAKTQIKRRELGLYSHLLILSSGIALVQLYDWFNPVGYFIVFVVWIWIHEKFLQISYSVKVVSHRSEEFEVLDTKDNEYAERIEHQINQAIKAVNTSHVKG